MIAYSSSTAPTLVGRGEWRLAVGSDLVTYRVISVIVAIGQHTNQLLNLLFLAFRNQVLLRSLFFSSVGELQDVVDLDKEEAKYRSFAMVGDLLITE